jgi:hypothetical protein
MHREQTMLTLRKKPSLSDFIKTCLLLYRIPELEETIRQRVEAIVMDLLALGPETDPVKNLTRFLQKDPNFLGVVLALTNLSEEKFLRILTAERFATGDLQRMGRKASFPDGAAR